MLDGFFRVADLKEINIASKFTNLVVIFNGILEPQKNKNMHFSNKTYWMLIFDLTVYQIKHRIFNLV